MKFLLSSPAYNQDIQHKALALYEADALGMYYSNGVDHYQTWLAKKFRTSIRYLSPSFDHQLQRRHIDLIPDDCIHSDWTWEALRTLAFRLKMSPSVADWFWEKSEHRLDSKSAKLMLQSDFGAFIGSEHSCLETVKQCAKLGKPSIVIFLSPHHSAKKQWVDPEYEAFPELLLPSTKRLLALAVSRDNRRDEEAYLADVIVTNSNFTTQSLVKAGVSPYKIITIPHGSPPVREDTQVSNFSTSLKFMYAGPVSVRKGAYYLLKAWKLAQGQLRHAELHFFGSVQLPIGLLPSTPDIFFHGSVAQTQLFEAYHNSSALIFPTLLDGFGLVVTEALAQGLPVITTPNAGAADLIEPGKNGFLVPPRDVEALAERLVWCVEHPEELYNMRHAALATAKKQTWAKVREDFRQKLGEKLGISLSINHLDN